MVGPVSLKPIDDLDKRFKGLVMPLDKKPGGFFHISFTREIIKSSIRMILLTRRGERVMLPEFGSQIHLLLFEPNDEILRSLAERYIIDDLSRWEPRIRVTGIRTQVSEDEHELAILIDYEILASATEDAVTLVFRREGGGLGRPSLSSIGV